MKNRIVLLIVLSVVIPAWTQSATGHDTQSGSNQQPMYMLTYDHGGLILWGTDHFRERLRNAIEWIDKYPGFKIGLDNEAYVYDYMHQHDPDLLKELQGYLKKYPNRFGIGSCTYGQPLSQFIGGESNIRQIGYAVEAVQKYFDYTPHIYLMSEHANHSQIPQILKGFGFDGAIMRTHFMMYGFNPTYDAAFGWWTGMDGSRIPTVPTYTGEGAEFFKTTVDTWILTRYPSEDAKQSLHDFRTQFAHINPLLATRADDSGLRREELVREYEGNTLFRWILLDDLLDLYEKPVVEFVARPDDFTVRMPWGYCGNEIWNMSRQAEVRVLTAERLAAFEYLYGGANREQDCHESWKNLLVAQHHDVQIVGLIPDAKKFLSTSLSASNHVIEKSLQFFADRLTGKGVQQITVFNPVSWQRSEWIETRVDFKKGEAQDINIYYGNSIVPSVVLEAHRFSDGSLLQGKVAFMAELPPMSVNSYSVVPVPERSPELSRGILFDQQQLSIETPFYQVKLHDQGGLASFIQKESGKNIFIDGKRSGIFCGQIDGKVCESRGRWSIDKVDHTAPEIKASERGFIADIPYTLDMIFSSTTPRIDCSVHFHFDNQKIGKLSDNLRDRTSAFIHEKKLRFKIFPALGENVTGLKDLPFVITETSNQVVEGNYWMAVTDNFSGLAIFNQGTMGSVREADGGFSLPLAFAMYYIWGTRMLQGDYSYEFALLPFSGQWPSANLHRQALEYNFPVQTTCGAPGNATFAHHVDVLTTDSDQVLTSALYIHKNKVTMRMFEHAGRQTDVALTGFMGDAAKFIVDLSGNKKRQIQNNLFFKPWQFQTIKINR